MQTILPSKNIIGDYLKSIHTIPTCNPICKSKCNTPLQKKGNLKLYALTSMQTKNQNEKHETTLPIRLDKALLFKVKKVRGGKGSKI